MIMNTLSKLCHTVVAKMPHQHLGWEAKFSWATQPKNGVELYHTYIDKSIISERKGEYYSEDSVSLGFGNESNPRV